MKKSLMVFVYWLTLFAITLSGVDVYSASKYESEPNENKTTATAINFGDKMVGNMWHSLDYDWYSISDVPEGLVSLTAYYEFSSGSTADTDNLYVELRDSSNKVISDFFIDYFDSKSNTPYIRDINIPTSGTYYIVAHCPSQAKFKRDRYYISMSKGGGENATIKILNEEDTVSIPADEKSTATLTALVRDENGNPVEGAMVVFSRAFGDSINPKNNELVFSGSDIDSEGITDNFFLFSGEKDISITYATWSDLLSLRFKGYFKAQLINTETGVKTYIFSTTDDVTNNIITKDIPSDANYYLEITTQNGANDVWEVKIPNKSFSTVSDEIGTSITDANGEAKYTYRSTDQKGDFTIKASFGNYYDRLVIKQIAGNASKVNIVDLVENTDSNLLYINREYTLSVAVTDKNGNLVEDGTDISLITNNTGIKINTFTAKTKSGMAKFTISASTAKEYTLTASVVGNSAIKDTITLNFNTITLSNIIAEPVYMLADGKSTSTISARLSDSNGLAVGGEPIIFTSNCGSLISNSSKTSENTNSETGDIQGVAKATLVAPLKAGICTVTASYGTAKLTIPIEFYGDGTGATTSSIELATSSNTVSANGKSSVVLTATLKDNADQPVAAGTPVVFKTDKGMFLNGSQEFKGTTPAGGVVKASLITRPEDTAGKANITCSSGGITQSIQVTFTAVNSDGSNAGDSTAYIKLSAAPTTIPADGKSSLMITAELLNSTNKPVPAGTEIAFYASNGTFANGVRENGVSRFTAATTDDAGKVYVALISSTTSGSVELWCLSNGVYQLTTVTFKGSNVTPSIGTITLSANPTTIPADGVSSTSITADIKDISGNPVPSGTSVTFTTNIGKFSNSTTTITVKTNDESGKLIIPLISASTAGYAQITANSGGVTQSTLVTFEGGSTPNIGMITLTANPTSISADGSSSTSITAVIKDAGGKAVPSNTSVVFTTTSGKFSNGTTTITVKTPDSSGTVIVPLVASTTAGTASVTATAGGVSQKVTVTFKGSGTTDIGTISLTASPSSLPADGSSSTSIKADVKDTAGKAVSSGTSIVFTTTAGKFSNNTKTITVVTPDDTGSVTIPLIADTSAGTATIKAAVGNVSQIVSITFVGSQDNSSKAKYLSLSLSTNSVRTDNFDSAAITATVLDTNRVPLSNVKITFTIESDLTICTNGAGMLSNAFPVTDASGKAIVYFSSGYDCKSNQNVTITAKITDAIPVLTSQVPIKIAGTTITVDPGLYTTLELAGNDTSTLTITAKDAGGNPINGASINVSRNSTSVGTVTANGSTLPFTTGKTDIDGKLQVTIKATVAGAVTLTITGLGDTKTQVYTVVAGGGAMKITTPSTDSIDLDIGVEQAITVSVPPITAITPITFISTIGMFSSASGGALSPTLTINAPISAVTQNINAFFKASTAGVASIYVYGTINGSAQNDSFQAIIAAPANSASQISLQASPTIVAPNVDSFSDLTATVKNAAAQPVEGATVAFLIVNPVGGGETISPVIATTNSSGIATARFTSGTLSSGGSGIKVIARVVGKAFTGPISAIRFADTNPDTIVRSDGGDFRTIAAGGLDGFTNGDIIRVIGSTLNDNLYTINAAVTNTTITVSGALQAEGPNVSSVVVGTMIDDVDITIGGTPGSIVIGRGTTITSDATNTYYILPMSILVSDSGGHPVGNQEVSLNNWPLQYAKGVWTKTVNPLTLVSEFAPDYTTAGYGWFDNEDANRNTILDAGETDATGDGITPPNSSAGNIPSKLTTDANGVANFNLVYLKHYGVWIRAEISATTIVSGSATKSMLIFILPVQKGEEESLPGASPFN
ncbi:MAG: Ig-like domain-containing protein [Desulfamplus sp.]|nr:Ig-like domain-containing protein [Desulfamplus sp.]